MGIAEQSKDHWTGECTRSQLFSVRRKGFSEPIASVISANVKDHQERRNWKQRLSLASLMGVNRLLARVYHRVEVKSPPTLPRKGAAILVRNHISGLDPVILQSAISRPIVWMMAREY